MVTEQGYSYQEAAKSLDITDKLLHNWQTKIEMQQEVANYMKYYNNERPHSSLGNLTPIEYENSLLNVSEIA